MPAPPLLPESLGERPFPDRAPAVVGSPATLVARAAAPVAGVGRFSRPDTPAAVSRVGAPPRPLPPPPPPTPPPRPETPTAGDRGPPQTSHEDTAGEFMRVHAGHSQCTPLLSAASLSSAAAGRFPQPLLISARLEGWVCADRKSDGGTRERVVRNMGAGKKLCQTLGGYVRHQNKKH